MVRKHAEKVKTDLNILLGRHGYFVKATLLRQNILFVTMSDSVIVSKKVAQVLNMIGNVANWSVYGETIKLTIE